MDIVAHALYGATAFSRSGLAGGPAGSRRPTWVVDGTAWAAAAFGILPDAVSMGIPFALYWAGGLDGNFFHGFDGRALVLYRCMHSLLIALAACGLLRLAWRPAFVPSLAWPLHILMDSVTHGVGKYHTTLLYPLSTWGLDGVRWWQHPEVIAAYWITLPLLWLGLWLWRRARRREEAWKSGRAA